MVGDRHNIPDVRPRLGVQFQEVAESRRKRHRHCGREVHRSVPDRICHGPGPVLELYGKRFPRRSAVDVLHDGRAEVLRRPWP